MTSEIASAVAATRPGLNEPSEGFSSPAMSRRHESPDHGGSLVGEPSTFDDGDSEDEASPGGPRRVSFGSPAERVRQVRAAMIDAGWGVPPTMGLCDGDDDSGVDDGDNDDSEEEEEEGEGEGEEDAGASAWSAPQPRRRHVRRASPDGSSGSSDLDVPPTPPLARTMPPPPPPRRRRPYSRPRLSRGYSGGGALAAGW